MAWPSTLAREVSPDGTYAPVSCAAPQYVLEQQSHHEPIPY